MIQVQKQTIVLCALLFTAILAVQVQGQNPWEKQNINKSNVAHQSEIHPLLQLTGPYQPNDESLSKHQQPKWFSLDKIGLSMHWGIYAVPGWAPSGVDIGESYAEWYGNKINNSKAYQEYHKKTYGDKKYDEFITEFKTENFNADEWIRTLKENGVKYFFITSKHHDGFCLWDTKYTNRNAMKMGPKRDLLGELGKACRKYGIKYGFYYSLYEWYNPLYLRDHDPENRDKYNKMIADGQYTGLIEQKNYVDDFMIPQLVELTEKYNPDLFYFDGEWDHEEPFWKMRQFVAWYYNRAAANGQEVMVNDRWGKGLRGKVGDLVHVEYEWGAELRGGSKVWAEWRGFGNSFGYNRNEKSYISSEEAIRTMVRCASGNGNVEFNIGPTADGRIPDPDLALLKAMGKWLKTNKAAIYGAKSNPIGKIDWGCISWKPKKKKLYLHVFNWPENGVLNLPRFKNKVKSARLLADPKRKLKIIGEGQSLKIKGLPDTAPDKAATVIEVIYQGDIN